MTAYSIVDIPGWENLPLGAADRNYVDERIEQLADGSVPDSVPRDSATPFRREVRKHLVRVVEQARSTGAGLICIPTQRMGDITVPASYTVVEWRDSDPAEIEPTALLQVLAAQSSGSARLIDVDGQPALREEEVEPGAADDPLARYAGRRVTYTISSPEDARSWVVFTFVTIGNGDPDAVLSRMLVELFDALLTTLRWSALDTETGFEFADVHRD